MMMRKFAAVFLAATLCTALFTVSAGAASGSKRRDLGQDSMKMTWYIIDFGVDNYNVPYAVARKYYTNPIIKQDAIEQLTSRYEVEQGRAERLYFTEYGYEYNQDGSQYSVSYIRHYDIAGNEIYGFDYDDSSEARRRFYLNVTPNTTPSKGAAYALGRLH